MIGIEFRSAQCQWLEVTWAHVTQLPDTITPATPALYDADGNEVRAAEPEQTVPGGTERKDIKHTSYHPTQLAMLQADAAEMGTPLDEHMDMLNAWVASYVPPEPEPTPLPQVVTIRQARRALLAAGLLDDVEAAVAAADRASQIDWEYATEVRRDHPLIAAMQVSCHLADEAVDALFVAASEIV